VYTSGRRLGCKAPVTVRLMCSGWKCHHDALAMRLPLRQDATDEGRLGCSGRWCGAAVASLEFKCYWCNALTTLTDEGMRAVGSLTALTSLEAVGSSKATDERMRAELLPAHVQRTKAGLSREAASSPSTRRSFCEVHRAAEGAGGTRQEMPNLEEPFE
jgi:hypothetical protein